MLGRPTAAQALAGARALLGRLLVGVTTQTAKPAPLPPVQPTYGPFSDRAAADVALGQLTREHLKYLNSQRGFLQVEQAADGSFWVVRHLGGERWYDGAVRVLEALPPVP